ncbi:programmed cell death protein 4 [Schistocerca gregaria]|uniref:programmed cell death protein 4 n=1 Tax=Schistocerca gregaria TaxID=7010 RepID=UPI00211DFB48|nr:programmed cell death protein 4 [Schistocerca gregaria]
MMEQDMINGQDNDIDEAAEDGVVNGDIAGKAGPVDSKASDSVSVDNRIKRKARRLIKQLSKEVVTNGTSVALRKNSRRPRNGFGRGLPKKGGAGGKGVWGKLGSELEEADVDMNDPNYDDDSLDSGDVALETIIPQLSEEEIRKAAEPIILEYFEHGDTAEAALAFDELNCANKRFMIPMLAIEIAMDHKPSHREMTSVLISDFYGRVVSQKDIALAFDLLLKNLPDLILDTPDAATVLGNFIARAVADDCLPPKFVMSYKDKVECEHARKALSRADTLLSIKHGMVRLDNVWGVGGGLRPVKYLTRQMTLLLQEYLSSEDLQEATRCLLELEVPHFHHELVYEAVVMTIEAINGHTEELMCKLLKSLYSAIIITPDMMDRGFLRVYEDMPDICLDVPLAYTVLERFVERCQKAGILGEEVIKKLPSRGRKRFVSEGDGGRVKSYDFV